MARPKIPLDEERIAEMALKGAKNSEIAHILGVDDQTIEKRFSLILLKKRAERKYNLKRKQYDKAMLGDTTMLVWLGKNELEQTDRQSLEHSGAIKTGDKLTIHVVHTKPGDKDNGNGNGGEKK